MTLKKKFAVSIALALIMVMCFVGVAMVNLPTAKAGETTTITYEEAKAQDAGGEFVTSTTGTFNDGDSTYTSLNYNNGSDYTDNSYDQIYFGANKDAGYTEFVLEMTLTLNIKNQWGNVRLYFNVYDNLDWGGNYVEFKNTEVQPSPEQIAIYSFTRPSETEKIDTLCGEAVKGSSLFNGRKISVKLVSQYTNPLNTNDGYTTTLFIDGVKVISASGVTNMMGRFGMTTWNGAYKLAFPIEIKSTVTADDLKEDYNGGDISYETATGSTGFSGSGKFDAQKQVYYVNGYDGKDTYTDNSYDSVMIGGRRMYNDFVLTMDLELVLFNEWSNCNLFFHVPDNKDWMGQFIKFSKASGTMYSSIGLYERTREATDQAPTDTLKGQEQGGMGYVPLVSKTSIKLVSKGDRAAFFINGKKIVDTTVNTWQGFTLFEFYNCYATIHFPIGIKTTVEDSDFNETCNGNGKTIDMYLIGGQSNAAGYSAMATSSVRPDETFENVWYAGSVDKALDKDYYDKSINSQYFHAFAREVKTGFGQYQNQMGPEYGMAKALNDSYAGETKALIFKSAAGGSALSDREFSDAGNPQWYGNWQSRSMWAQGYTPNITTTTTDATGVQYALFLANFTQVYNELKANGYNPVVKGMAWMQGEADIGVANYDELLKTFITDLRADLVSITGDQTLTEMPFAIGKIARSFDMWESAGAIAINELQQKAADALTAVKTVETADLIIVKEDGSINGTDRYHFNANDCETLGVRFGEKLIEIIDEETVPFDMATAVSYVGAQIRLTEPTGLRFIFKVTAQNYATLNEYYGAENVSFGAILISEDLSDGFTIETAEVTDCPCVNWFSVAPDREYTAVVIDIPSDAYGLNIVAKAYVKVIKDGKTIYYYAGSGTASLSSVSAQAVADLSETQANEYQNAVDVEGATMYSPYTDTQREFLNGLIVK